jgi:hypothetical protein
MHEKKYHIATVSNSCILSFFPRALPEGHFSLLAQPGAAPGRYLAL